MEVRDDGLSIRLESLTDADDEALVGETDDTAGATEPAEQPETGVKRGKRIGWWW